MTNRTKMRARHRKHKQRAKQRRADSALFILRELVRKVSWHTNYYPDVGPTGRVLMTDVLGFQAIDALRNLRDADALLDSGGYWRATRGHF